jgi:membrane associated rhomboid family serine protease
LELKEFRRYYQTLENWYPKNTYLKPIPVIIGMTIILIGVFGVTSLNPTIYDILKQGKTNPHGLLTSLFIHDLDNLDHLTFNLLGLWIFGYLVSVQTSHTRMFFVFVLCGVLANVSIDVFGNLLNSIVTPTFITWATSSGYSVGEGLQLIPSPSGGGASDGLTGLIGFAVALAIDYFFANIREAYQSGNSITNRISHLKKSLSSTYCTTMIHFIALLGVIILDFALKIDLEMFSYVLTHNYAGATGTFLPFPSSGGHPLLAHVFGGLIGFILGIYYVKRNKNENINLGTDIKTEEE